MRKIALTIIAAILGLATHGQIRYEVTHVHDSINTPGSETGAIIVDDSVLLFTSLQEEGNRQYLMDFNPMLNKIFTAPIASDGTLGKGQICSWGMNSSNTSCGNVTYDAKNDIIYFTRGESRSNDNNMIYYSFRQNGRWSKAQAMGGNVNLKGYNNTHPAIGYLPSGEPILYFSSNRPGGQGGMDLWYSVIISRGIGGNCTNLGPTINTDSNEVTPFYSYEDGRLYFSSNRKGGLGGYDIYQAEGARNSWQLPQTLGKGINTKFDDLFFTQQPCRCRCELDSTNTTEVVESCGFLASNRPGSLFTSDSNCCNDLFRWRRWRRIADEPDTTPRPPARSALDLLPLSLYFHNDEPNPKTLDTTTSQDYSSTYKRYIVLCDEYKGAQPSPADRRKWDSIQKGVDYFFNHELKRGYSDMLQFMEFLYQDLKAGKHICITINGFASPLFESLYNVNISKRRIDSFRNQLKHWNDEALLPYLNNGMLKIESVANGAPGEEEVAVTDPLRNPKSEKSVYSMDAAHARRIDIIGYYITK